MFGLNKEIIKPTYEIYDEMLDKPHLLIAGATGSGKSCLENALVYTSFFRPSAIVCIDTKRTELVQYKRLRRCWWYADTPESAVEVLDNCIYTIESRFREMQRRRQKMSTRGDIYIFIDECADLFLTVPKTKKQVQRIAQIGRAARVHLIMCTQTPISKVLPTEIKCNFDARIALRTRSAQDSRNILEITGAERLPTYGEGIYMTAQGYQLIDIPLYKESDINEVIRAQRKKPLFRK